MKDIRTWLIIGLAAVIVFLLLFQRSPADPDKIIYEDSVKTLQAHKRILSASIDSLVETSNHKAKVSDSLLTESLKEIERLKVKANRSVQNIPVKVLEENPEVPIALAYLDDVIEKQAVLIDTLQNQLQFERNVREQLTSLHYDSDKINAQLQEMADMRIVKLENDLRKERTRGKIAKILIPIALIGGFLLGNQ